MSGTSNFDISKPKHSTSLVTLYYIYSSRVQAGYRDRSGARSEECAGLFRQAPLRVDELEEVDAVDGGHVGTLGRQHRVRKQRVRQLAEVVHKLDGLLLKFRVVEELVDLREDVDAGVAERTLLLLRDDAAGEHPPHHVDLVGTPPGGGGGGREQGEEEDASHRFRGRLPH